MLKGCFISLIRTGYVQDMPFRFVKKMKTKINEAKPCAKNVPRQNESRIDVTQHRVV